MRLRNIAFTTLWFTALGCSGGSGRRATCGEALQLPPCPEEDPWADEWVEPAEEPYDWGYVETGLIDPAPEDWQPLATLKPQSVWWSAMSVSTTDAKIARLPEATRIDVQIEIESHDRSDTDFRDRDTWDLKLADGERLRPYDFMGLLLAPGDAAKTTLRYQASPDAPLDGAALELNGYVRGSLEPEPLPLDVSIDPIHSYALTDLEGVIIAAENEEQDKFEILTARWGANSPLGKRSEPGKRYLTVIARITAGDHWSVYYDDDFKTVFDGYSHTTDHDSDCSLSIEFGEADECALLYSVDADATEGALDVGRVNAEPVRLAFSMANAVPMTSP